MRSQRLAGFSSVVAIQTKKHATFGLQVHRFSQVSFFKKMRCHFSSFEFPVVVKRICNI